MEELWELEARKLASGRDNLSSSPRYARLRKSAAQAVLSWAKNVLMKQQNNPLLGVCGGVFFQLQLSLGLSLWAAPKRLWKALSIVPDFQTLRF